MFKHLLVPTDGSALSEAAIQMAVALARESKARVTGLHVMPEYHVFAYGTEMLIDTEEQFTRAAQQHADDYLDFVAKATQQAGVDYDTVATVSARPYEAIIATAKQRDCDLIVMASHGRSGVRALLIGSETQKVLTHSQIPVLVVRQSTQTGTGHRLAASAESSSESSASSSTSKHSPMQKFIVARAAAALGSVRVWRKS
jgi:nucleotide-binding universal stress UspA family protein